MTQTKASWLRSEIEKLEGIIKQEVKKLELPEKYKDSLEMNAETLPIVMHNLRCELHPFDNGYNTALTSIITRYKEELKVLESK